MRHPSLLPVQLRPRERLLREGSPSLSDEELWMCVLGNGYRHNALNLMVKRWETMRTAETLDPVNITRAFGPAQASRLLAVRELQERYAPRLLPKIASAHDVLQLCSELVNAKTEELWAFYCSLRGEVLHQERLALGGLNVVHILPRDILRPLFGRPVDSLVLCHNHPSGHLDPSGEDIVFTRRIEAACQILGLTLRDHIIVTKSGYYSFAEYGMLGSADG